MPLKYDAEYIKAYQPILDMVAAAPKAAVHDVQARRQGLERGIAAFMSHFPDCPNVEETVYRVATSDGFHVPVHGLIKKGTASAPPGPAVLHVHGGGMIVGSVNMFARPLRAQVESTGVPFFSVDYRLAPEANSTTLAEDCYAGLIWLSQNAAKFNVDPARIAVMGESAGGGLAAGVALMARDRKLDPPLAKQILIYPMLDDQNLIPDAGLEPFVFWKTEDNLTGWTALLGDKAGKADAEVSPYCAPARVQSVAGLPPTYMDVGDLDLFRNEDIRYAMRLAAENITLELHVYPGVPHGFEIWCPDTAVAKQAVENRHRAITTF